MYRGPVIHVDEKLRDEVLSTSLTFKVNEKSLKAVSVVGSAPNPYHNRKFTVILLFLNKFMKGLPQIFENFLNFTILQFSEKIIENFYAFRGSAPRTPTIAYLYNISHFPNIARKKRIFSVKVLPFSDIFSIPFHF